MKNIVNYVDEFMDDDFEFESVNTKLKKSDRKDLSDYIKTNRKLSRDEEIEKHAKPVNHNNVFRNKKAYNRKNKHKSDYE